MDLLLQAVLTYIQSGAIYFENKQIKSQLEQRILHIMNNRNNHSSDWAVTEMYHIAVSMLGATKAYHLLYKMHRDYGSELETGEKQVLQNYISMLEMDLRKAGINLEKIQRSLGIKPEVERMHLSETKRERKLFQESNPNVSYSGSDMVASINVPGKGPIVFGELSNISYSVLREKVPVRSLGRVSMKGYTRGMRTISGILTFTVFDESIVYRCMEELKEHGYRMLMDEMPLFDITITMANEFGSRSSLTLYGISTYTEGMVLSIQDMMTQNVYEFYALDIDPMAKKL